MNFIFADLWWDVLLNFTFNNINIVYNKFEYMHSLSYIDIYSHENKRMGKERGSGKQRERVSSIWKDYNYVYK